MQKLIPKIFVIIFIGFFSNTMAQGNFWTTKSPMNSLRTSLGPHAAVVEKKIYIIGGFDGSIPLTSVEEYDVSLDSWSIVSHMDSARSQLELAVLNDKIYILGGTVNYPYPTSTVLEYDPQMNSWESKADMLTARKNVTAVVLDNEIYVIGGLNMTDQNVATVESFSPAMNSWETKSDMNFAKSSASASVLNGKIYVFGGFDQFEPLSSIEEYDPNTNNWTVLESTIVARNLHTTAVVGEKIYIFGGGAIPGVGISDTVEVFDPSTGSVTPLKSMDYARAALASAAVDDKIYVMGGRLSDNSICNIVEEYTPLDPATIEFKDHNKKLVKYKLYQNFPNPFNPLTTISYTLRLNSNVNLLVFDLRGRLITTLIDQHQNAGEYSILFDGSNLSTGLYIYQLKAGSFIQKRKMVLCR
jgi:N-acetylneuraminic acid mutarotase